VYPRRHLRTIGGKSLNPLQRLIRTLYLKYVYRQEQEVLLDIFILDERDAKTEMAMIEKEYYEIDNKLH